MKDSVGNNPNNLHECCECEEKCDLLMYVQPDDLYYCLRCYANFVRGFNKCISESRPLTPAELQEQAEMEGWDDPS